MKKSFYYLTLWLMLLSINVVAQRHLYNVNRIDLLDDMTYYKRRQIIRLPSVNGLVSLKCDFHTHTVFSDGDLWPSARVEEAWRDGLDAIAITDHKPSAPQMNHVKGDANSAYKLALGEAERSGLMVIQGTEIGHSKEGGGHINAIFITDATKTVDVPMEVAVKEAVKQGGYIIWNHPGWDIDSCIMFDVNKRLIDAGLIHAVEVFCDAEWYPRALRWCRDFNLAPLADTDIHDFTHSMYGLSRNAVFRPMTIVLAREKTQDALKEALFKRNTIAFFHGMLAGDSRLLADFFFASISVKKVKTLTDSNRKTQNYYVFCNPYDVPYVLLLENGKKMTLLANSETSLSLPGEIKAIKANILNLHTYEFETLEVTVQFPE